MFPIVSVLGVLNAGPVQMPGVNVEKTYIKYYSLKMKKFIKHSPKFKS